jgi:hypothetical protein
MVFFSYSSHGKGSIKCGCWGHYFMIGGTERATIRSRACRLAATTGDDGKRQKQYWRTNRYDANYQIIEKLITAWATRSVYWTVSLLSFSTIYSTTVLLQLLLVPRSNKTKDEARWEQSITKWAKWNEMTDDKTRGDLKCMQMTSPTTQNVNERRLILIR